MSNVPVVICDTKEKIITRYETSIIPRKGELINLTHSGTFRILDVAYRIADDQCKFNYSELLMYVEVIIDPANHLKEFDFNQPEE